LLCEGKNNRVVAYKNGGLVDYDIEEALAMKKDLDEDMVIMSQKLSRK
jgi:6-phosphofructokinase 1